MKNLSFLIESELEKAEITLAIKDISDSLQKFASDLSRIAVDDVPSVIERIKETHGINVGNEFGKTITEYLQTLTQSILDTKSRIDDKALVISGDATENELEVPNDLELDDEKIEEPKDDLEEPSDEIETPSFDRRVKESRDLPIIVKKLLREHSAKNRKVITEMYQAGGERRNKVMALARKVFESKKGR